MSERDDIEKSLAQETAHTVKWQARIAELLPGGVINPKDQEEVTGLQRRIRGYQ